jgi:hypothetical protein
MSSSFLLVVVVAVVSVVGVHVSTSVSDDDVDVFSDDVFSGGLPLLNKFISPSSGLRDLPPPYCDPSLCASNQTCCLLDSTGQPGCFAGANATCCGFNDEACPNGFLCDPIKNNCAAINNGTLCQGCLATIPYIEGAGCEYACQLIPPPFDYVCDFIVKVTDLCERIGNWSTHGLNGVAICAEIGLCGGGTCKCGFCNKWTGDDTRCLSLPNKCPSSVSVFDADPEEVDDLAFCLNGKCDSNHLGCCLTCF